MCGGETMRIKIAHERTKPAVIEAVDRSFSEMFKGAAGLPVKLTVEKKSWEGPVLSFALSANMEFISTPIKGTVEVDDKEVTVDVDLGMLGRFLSEGAAKDMIERRVKGLLDR
jgi:Putative polyhydroxyalkanoic acid system protein (PHA_gran_rgn)